METKEPELKAMIDDINSTNENLKTPYAERIVQEVENAKISKYIKQRK